MILYMAILHEIHVYVQVNVLTKHSCKRYSSKYVLSC